MALKISEKPAIPHTNLIVWPEPMSQPSFIDANVARAESSQTKDCDVARASLARLRDLEASQQALLRRDRAAVELGTLEQRRLQRALELLWDRNPIHPHRDDAENDGHPQQNFKSPSASDSWPELAGELRAAGLRLLHLGRVQAVLLERAQTAQADQFQRSIGSVQAELENADSTLNSVTTALQRALTLGVEGSNGTLNSSDQQALAVEVQGIQSQLLNLANLSYQGN